MWNWWEERNQIGYARTKAVIVGIVKGRTLFEGHSLYSRKLLGTTPFPHQIIITYNNDIYRKSQKNALYAKTAHFSHSSF